MAVCPQCATRVEAWRTWIQTTWTTFHCRRCAARLRLNRPAMMVTGGIAGVAGLLAVRLAQHNAPAGLLLLAGLLALTLAAATIIPCEAVSPDEEDARPSWLRSRSVRVALGVLVLGGGLAVVVRSRASVASLPLERNALPGLEVWLPAGRVTHELARYTSGQLNLTDIGGARGMAQVDWTGAPFLDADEKTDLTRQLGVPLHETARDIRLDLPLPIPGGLRGDSWSGWLGRFEFWFTEVQCGARRVLLLTGSERAGVEQLHRRIVATLRCQPDPQQEALIGDVPAIADLGPSWWRLADSKRSNQLQLTDGENAVLVQTVNAGKVGVVTESFLKSLPGIELGARQGESWPITITVGRERRTGWLEARTCPESGGSLLLMSLPAAATTDGLAVLDGIRCRLPGEAAQVWPDHPPHPPAAR